MQRQKSAPSEIEHLLFELTWCVNDLQGFRRQLSIDDIQQADLSLQKLSALITQVKKQSNPLRLAAV
jgi:hypothetical protein